MSLDYSNAILKSCICRSHAATLRRHSASIVASGSRSTTLTILFAILHNKWREREQATSL